MEELFVACLCAEWCGTCREYHPLFEQLQARFPQVRWAWVDVEDEADLVDPVEVENFPTLLVARRDAPLFFGTITPHLPTLERLLRSQLEPGAPALPPEPERDAMVQRLRRRHI